MCNWTTNTVNKLDSKNKLKFHFKNKKLNCKNGLHDALG